MELQLGLALPSMVQTKEFDLNTCGYETKDLFRSDLQLNHEEDCNSTNMKKKRSFYEAFDDDFLTVHVPQTLPLFFWDDNNTTNVNKDAEENSAIDKSEGDENGVIGWPPIKSCRKNFCQGGGGGSNKSMYVKVKMEGVAIARKVDLSRHHSYETLTYTLVGMFGKRQEDIKAYKLTFLDKEGDWLLAGDVPWGSFMRSVQSLKLVKSGG